MSKETPWNQENPEVEFRRNLKIGDEVIVNSGAFVDGDRPVRGKVVEVRHPGEDVPGPDVELLEGEYEGKRTGNLYNSEYRAAE